MNDELAPGFSQVWPTVIAVLLVPVALMFGGLAPMAADSCGPDNCSAALDAALAAVMAGWVATIVVTPGLLLGVWLLPRSSRFDRVRRAAAWGAVLPPAAVILMVLALPEG
ncbi:hypothetical protein ACFVGY_08275 [Streptomyces sp. NPDC127106]|uniref:hypothetical protein n=1 Tax=Streptomyces sp. NPDC127106 TaxID=3345360 RepID=UPI003625ADA3